MQYVVQAAYWSARTRGRDADGNDKWVWWKSTISAFDQWRKLAPVTEGGRSSALGSREAGMAAEAEYALVDEELRTKFDYETGYHRYKGTAVRGDAEVPGRTLVEAKKWDDRLQHVVDAYVLARVDRGCAGAPGHGLGLGPHRPLQHAAPGAEDVRRQAEALLKRAENSDNPDLQAQADEVRV